MFKYILLTICILIALYVGDEENLFYRDLHEFNCTILLFIS